MDSKRNDMCHKNGKHGHSIKDYRLYIVKFKKYVKNVGDREKKMDWVLDRYCRRVVADNVVKKFLESKPL